MTLHRVLIKNILLLFTCKSKETFWATGDIILRILNFGPKWRQFRNLVLTRLHVFSGLLKMLNTFGFLKHFCNIRGGFCVYSQLWWLLEHLMPYTDHVDHQSGSCPLKRMPSAFGSHRLCTNGISFTL